MRVISKAEAARWGQFFLQKLLKSYRNVINGSCSNISVDVIDSADAATEAVSTVSAMLSSVIFALSAGRFLLMRSLSGKNI